MFSASTWLHLRFPFSYFLLPVYLFAVSISPNINGPRLGWTFLILHLLLYPASNGYNSYFDKDKKSIGGLKNPPPVTTGLYFMAIALDVAAIMLSYIKIGFLFSLMVLIYGLVSKAYSHPAIRLKKLPITGWIVAGLFQGLFTFLMAYVGINNYSLEIALRIPVLWPAFLCSLMLWANYPMTQVYQHQEDGERGDKTLSLVLGIRNTFIFSMLFFLLATVGFIFYFSRFYQNNFIIDFLIAMTPTVLFFLFWMRRAWVDPSKANYSHTMWLNFISATSLSGFFIYFFLTISQINQVFS